MANWEKVLELGDLISAFENKIIGITELGKHTSKRLKELYPENNNIFINNIIESSAKINSIDEYDNILEQLYNWGDVKNRLWIETW
jgi:NAD/NADP transhydrogenase alpha subunit